MSRDIINQRVVARDSAATLASRALFFVVMPLDWILDTISWSILAENSWVVLGFSCEEIRLSLGECS